MREAGRRGKAAEMITRRKQARAKKSELTKFAKKNKKNYFKNLATGKKFFARALRYANAAIADTKREKFNIWMQFAAKRFLADLARAKKAGNAFSFDEHQADRACRFIEGLPHVEGKWSSANIELHDSQVFFLVNVFGFRKADGSRRFDTALWAVARKNAKTTLAAGVMLYVMCEEPEAGGQIYSAATTGDQARAVYRIAKQMVERTTELRIAYGLAAYSLEIKRRDNDTFFKAINAKASTQDGLNPQAYVLDEVHAHKTHDLMNVLNSAQGARNNPLYLYTTTEGYETPGPWPEIRAYAQNILKGAVIADHFFAVYYSLDVEDKNLKTKQDDDFDDSKWIKANPLYDVNPILREKMHQLANEARSMAGKLGEFRIKRLNRQSSSANAWVDLLAWAKCAGPVDVESLEGVQCWGAFDLATTTDMAAWALVWNVADDWYCKLRYWVPQEMANLRREKRSANYQGWIDGGFVCATEGDVINYEVIFQDVMEDVRIYQPTKIAYDSWNAQQFVTRLVSEGLDLEMFIQGPKSYNPAMQALEKIYRSGRLHHGGNPVLQWNVANMVPRYDANMNMAPDKKRSVDKIDGAAALIMAVGMAVREVGDDSNGFFSEPVSG